MSMADCPHYPECGHRSESQCDCTGPNDTRVPQTEFQLHNFGERGQTSKDAKLVQANDGFPMGVAHMTPLPQYQLYVSEDGKASMQQVERGAYIHMLDVLQLPRVHQFRNLKRGVEWTNASEGEIEQMKKFAKLDPKLGLEFRILVAFPEGVIV